MSEETKFTEDELKEIKGIQDGYFNIQNQFGQLHMAQMRLEEQHNTLEKGEKEIEKSFEELQKKEKDFLDGITKKYGEGTLNPETGVFSPNKS